MALRCTENLNPRVVGWSYGTDGRPVSRLHVAAGGRDRLYVSQPELSRDGGVGIDHPATPRFPTHRESVDERVAIVRIARCGLGVATCGDADQRRDRGDGEYDGLIHLNETFRGLPGTFHCRLRMSKKL